MYLIQEEWTIITKKKKNQKHALSVNFRQVRLKLQEHTNTKGIFIEYSCIYIRPMFLYVLIYQRMTFHYCLSPPHNQSVQRASVPHMLRQRSSTVFRPLCLSTHYACAKLSIEIGTLEEMRGIILNKSTMRDPWRWRAGDHIQASSRDKNIHHHDMFLFLNNLLFVIAIAFSYDAK